MALIFGAVVMQLLTLAVRGLGIVGVSIGAWAFELSTMQQHLDAQGCEKQQNGCHSHDQHYQK